MEGSCFSVHRDQESSSAVSPGRGRNQMPWAGEDVVSTVAAGGRAATGREGARDPATHRHLSVCAWGWPVLCRETLGLKEGDRENAREGEERRSPRTRGFA